MGYYSPKGGVLIIEVFYSSAGWCVFHHSGMNLYRAFHRFIYFHELSLCWRDHWYDTRIFALEYGSIVSF